MPLTINAKKLVATAVGLSSAAAFNTSSHRSTNPIS